MVVGLLVASAAGFFDINFLGDATSVGTLAAFGIVCLTVIWLRRTHPEIPRGYRVPFYPVLPALGIVSCFALIFTVENRVLIFFGWYMVAAIVLYFVYGMHNSELAKGHLVDCRRRNALLPGGCSAGRKRQAGHPALSLRHDERKGRVRRRGRPFLMRADPPASAFRSFSGRAP